jgi:glutathione S-transferase kappa 1
VWQPQRAITYIKHAYPERFEGVLGLYWEWFFYQHQDLSKPDILRKCFLDAGLFSAEEVDGIMAAAGEKKWKDALTAKTQEALDRGAFGAPFFVVKSSTSDGQKEEVFWGSDR